MKPQVNKGHYFRKKYDDLNRFISYFYQVDLAQEVLESNTNPRIDTNATNKSILEIGKGNGFFSDYMKKLGHNVTTCDFDKNLQPDIVADVRSLPVPDNSFDLVTAFEILEHLPFEDFTKALAELKRVSSKYVVISLPYKSTGFEWIFKFPGVRTLFRKPFLDFFLRIPLKFGGLKVSGQHYWEIDCWRWRLSKIRQLLRQHFKIAKEMRPVLNHYHYFFVLEK
jgi:ubiquinone/menaquinone biosynthesis C-methylase UbiE